MKYYIYLITLFTLSFSSCSKYQKVLKSTDFNLKFEQAKIYYEKEDFNKAMPLFNELSTILRGTNKAEEVDYYYAYCHYSLGENLMAGYLFSNYIKNYPKSKHHEECSFMVAYCYYLEAPVYSLDSKNTKRAIKELQIFIDQNPNSKRVDQSNELIDELRYKLSEKAFEIAKQYYVTEHYKSAILALNNVLIDFPEIKQREDIHFLILDSSYLLAVNSIYKKKKQRLEEAIDIYRIFTDNYPESKYSSQANEVHQKSKELLKQLKTF